MKQDDKEDEELKDNTRVSLNLEGKELSLELLSGRHPSELGITFTEAALFLALFKENLRATLSRMDETGKCDQELKNSLTELLEIANELKELFADAGSLTETL